MKINPIKIPGKLYIAGEYSVLTPGHSALVAAVDRYIIFEAGFSSIKNAAIYSEGFMKRPIYWERLASGQIVLKSKFRFKYMVKAMEITERYIKEVKNVRTLPHYFIHTKTELKNHAGQKYGLGSSAAVTIGTIQTILELFKINYTSELLFKLGVITHLSIRAHGSFGDLAASAYSGFIHYTNFNRNQLIKSLHKSTINELLLSDWNTFQVKQLPIPNDWKLLVGWTGRPASTHRQIQKTKHKKKTSSNYRIQMSNIQEMVTLATSSIYKNDFKTFSDALECNQQLMRNLEIYTGRTIETADLHTFIAINQSFQLPAKISGAGGGDCGIAWTTNDGLLAELYNKWQQAKITPLKINIAQPKENYYET